LGAAGDDFDVFCFADLGMVMAVAVFVVFKAVVVSVLLD
jgi:hypothetical protein